MTALRPCQKPGGSPIFLSGFAAAESAVFTRANGPNFGDCPFDAAVSLVVCVVGLRRTPDSALFVPSRGRVSSKVVRG
jgi:hypothetical protein